MARRTNNGNHRPPSPQALRELATLDLLDAAHDLHAAGREMASAQRRLAAAQTGCTRARLRVVRAAQREAPDEAATCLALTEVA